MKFILSPARRMGLTMDSSGTEPLFPTESAHILEHLRTYTPWELESLFKANERLAANAFFDYQAFDFNKRGCPALFAYDGLVYKQIDPAGLSPAALEYAADTLRILSAFYGVLHPFDGIQPYRLEMNTRLSWNEGSLYQFWKDKLYGALYETSDCVINLASEEYAKCIRRYLKPADRFIDVVFLKSVNGRTPTTLTKIARGQMARLILENQIRQPEDLKALSPYGFVFSDTLSHSSRYVFCSTGLYA